MRATKKQLDKLAHLGYLAVAAGVYYCVKQSHVM